MKGIVLAAGRGTRLYPVTLPVCKPLVPVYDKPLIYYPLTVLMKAGIRDILIITPPGDTAPFINLLGDGSSLGIKITYKEQMVQRGIADAFIIGADFIGNDSVALALGDNIFYGPLFSRKLKAAAERTNDGAAIFGFYVADPRPFGVVEFDADGKAVSIEEKPKHPKSNYIVPGLYFYNNEVVDIAKDIKPSKRGELEITSINNEYLNRGKLNVIALEEQYTWFDAGNADSLYEAAGAIRDAQRSGKMIGCPEEVAFQKKWIGKEELLNVAQRLGSSKYGVYLDSLVDD